MPTTLSINGIALNPNMAWDDRYVAPDVPSSQNYTLGGRLIEVLGVVRERIVTLTATEEYGWLDVDTVEDILKLISNGPPTFNLVVDTETYVVGFRYEDKPVVDMHPLVSRTNQQLTDMCIGQIKLRMIRS